MARLFITSREINLISDITKEVIKDVVGQKVYYYRVREDLTEIHDVYEESQNKVFDPPIEIEARVEWQPGETRTNRFGSEEFATINVFFHEKDLIDREVDIRTGDYFSYGDTFFEITSAIIETNVYGQIEHNVGTKVIGKQARIGQIDVAPIGPTNAAYKEEDAVQDDFVQQRGFEENSEGKTGDKRALQENGKLDPPISGKPAEVKKVETTNDDGTATTESYFYD